MALKRDSEEVANLQRQRLQRVPDPIKYLISVNISDYPSSVYTAFK